MQAEGDFVRHSFAPVVPLEDWLPVTANARQCRPQVPIVHVIHCQNRVPLHRIKCNISDFLDSSPPYFYLCHIWGLKKSPRQFVHEGSMQRTHEALVQAHKYACQAAFLSSSLFQPREARCTCRSRLPEVPLAGQARPSQDQALHSYIYPLSPQPARKGRARLLLQPAPMSCLCRPKAWEGLAPASGGPYTEHRAHGWQGLAWIWQVQQGVGLWQPSTAACLQDAPCLLAGKSYINNKAWEGEWVHGSSHTGLLSCPTASQVSNSTLHKSRSSPAAGWRRQMEWCSDCLCMRAGWPSRWGMPSAGPVTGPSAAWLPLAPFCTSPLPQPQTPHDPIPPPCHARPFPPAKTKSHAYLT